ncbi:MAG: hypothetical protein HY982_02050 [Candidatus Magasanikbacteria bacterium]|nr:hypothetical protein [Candidatus Magasanikbacteria bacterium]
MNKKKVLSLVLSLFLVTVLALPILVSAEANLDLGINYGTYTGLGTKDVRETVGSIINVAMGLLGIVAVVIILIGGFEWMTAGGNEEKTGEAKKRILAGVIGLAIILSAYAIAKFVVSNLMSATK